MKNKVKKETVTLKGKIAAYLFVFGLALVSLLFVFQIVLLEPMYEHEKIDAVKKVGDEVTEALDGESLTETILSASLHNDTCVSITYNDVSMSQYNQSCTVFQQMSQADKDALIGFAAVSDNGTYVTIKERSFASQRNVGSFKDIIYTRLTKGNNGLAIIMIYAGISPISATRNTLRVQLLYISLILIVAILILTLIINRNIARPLTKITKAANGLPNGEFLYASPTNPYKEAEDLKLTLSQAARDIRKADKAKRDLIANVSHDLRTPLTMISGYGEMMRDLPGEKTDENCQVIIDEAQRLNHLVNDLLDLSKMQENTVTLHKSVFDLSEMIKTQLKKYEVYSYQENFNIETHLYDGIYIEADQKRLEQVINNFVINAINYAGSDKHVIIRELKDGDIVTVEVQDFGEGIEEEKLKDIWDRYFKIDKEHNRALQGSGIGLAIVKQVLELHGFEFGVRSKVNEGSTFYFKCNVYKK